MFDFKPRLSLAALLTISLAGASGLYLKASPWGLGADGFRRAPAAAGASQAPFDYRSRAPHAAQIIDRGVAAFELRLQMIEKARTSIDIEYFIYNIDHSGRIFSQALIRKKTQNPSIKIRVSIDASSTVLALTPQYTAELRKHGIDVRYYNDKPLVQIVSSQYRNHRKNLIIDGDSAAGEAITGGRNIGDEYFDLSGEFNFIDRDIWIQGPVVTQMQKAYDAYWASSVLTLPDEEGEENKPEAIDYVTENENDRAIRAEIAAIGGQQLRDPKSKGRCNEVHFITDLPGYSWGSNANSETRKVRDALLARVDEILSGGTVFVESPYFIIKERGSEAIDRLLAKGVKGVLLTNSLGSTDAYYVAAVFNSRLQNLAGKNGLTLFVHSGNPLENTRYVKDKDGNELSRTSRWGIHAKTILFDDQAFGVDTFNIDPRSANLNNELALICEKSPELANFVKESIHAQISQSYELGKDGKPLDPHVDLMHGIETNKVLKYFLAIIPASLLDFLL